VDCDPPLIEPSIPQRIVRNALDDEIKLEVDDRVAEYDMVRWCMPYRDVTIEDMVSQFGAENPAEFWLRVTSHWMNYSKGTGRSLSLTPDRRSLLLEARTVPAGISAGAGAKEWRAISDGVRRSRTMAC